MLSGIYETYAQMLESTGQLVLAYDQLHIALSYFGSNALSPDSAERISTAWTDGRKLTEKEHLRAIALNQKLGQLALAIASSSKVTPYSSEKQDGPTSYLNAAEMHLSEALGASLRVGLGSRARTGIDDSGAEGASPVVVGRDWQPPAGTSGSGFGLMDVQSLGMTMESLAEVYARKGQFEYAQQLLVQAISTLLPPNESDVPPRDRCQAAMVSNFICIR